MAQIDPQAKFLGEWELIPELCIYQAGHPPISGRYLIRSDSNQVHISIWWTDHANESHELSFGGILDGQRHAFEAPGVSHVMYEQLGPLHFDSTAYDGDEVVLYAKRVTSEAGDLLAVTQTQQSEQGQTTNFQVYRRKH